MATSFRLDVAHEDVAEEDVTQMGVAAGAGCGQAEVYDQCCSPLVAKFLAGANACLLTYGQTASGKTFTAGFDSEHPQVAHDCHYRCTANVVSCSLQSPLSSSESPA